MQTYLNRIHRLPLVTCLPADLSQLFQSIHLQTLTKFLQPNRLQNLDSCKVRWLVPMEHHWASLRLEDITLVLPLLLLERMDATRIRLTRELIPHLTIRKHGTNRMSDTLDLVLAMFMPMSRCQMVQQPSSYPSINIAGIAVAGVAGSKHQRRQMTVLNKRILVYLDLIYLRLLTYSLNQSYPCLRRRCNLNH